MINKLADLSALIRHHWPIMTSQQLWVLIYSKNLIERGSLPDSISDKFVALPIQKELHTSVRQLQVIHNLKTSRRTKDASNLPNTKTWQEMIVIRNIFDHRTSRWILIMQYKISRGEFSSGTKLCKNQ